MTDEEIISLQRVLVPKFGEDVTQSTLMIVTQSVGVRDVLRFSHVIASRARVQVYRDANGWGWRGPSRVLPIDVVPLSSQPTQYRRLLARERLRALEAWQPGLVNRLESLQSGREIARIRRYLRERDLA